MGNAPNIDLSQLMPGAKTPNTAVTASPSPSRVAADSGMTEFQGLDDLHLTMDILRRIDGQYFIGQDVEGEDLMHNVFGDLTQDLHGTATVTSLQEEEEEHGGEGVMVEEEEEERSAGPARSRVRESSL